MAERTFPFDGGQLVQESQWHVMAREWLGTGVLRGRLNQGAVTASGAGMTVDVAPVAAWIEGHYYDSDATQSKAITSAVSNQARVDRVVIHLDTDANTIDVRVLAGTPVTAPGVPVGRALTQNDTVWDLLLAEVYVGAAVGVIRPVDLADKRTYAAARSAALGLVVPPVIRTHNYPANDTYVTAPALIGSGGGNATNGGYPALTRTGRLDPGRLYRVTCTVGLVDGDANSGEVLHSGAGIGLRLRAGTAAPAVTDIEVASLSTKLVSDSTRGAGAVVHGYVNADGDASATITASGLYTVGAFLLPHSSTIGVRTSGWQALTLEDVGSR